MSQERTNLVQKSAEDLRNRMEAPSQASYPAAETGPVCEQATSISASFSEMNVQRKPLADLLTSLGVESTDSGLTEEAAKQRLETEGPNSLTGKKQPSWHTVYSSQVSTFFAVLLWAGFLLSLIVHCLAPDDPSNLSTALAIFSVGAVSFYQGRKSRSTTASDNDFTPTMCQVIRETQQKSLKAADLVRGISYC